MPGEPDPAEMAIHNAWWSGARAEHPADTLVGAPPDGAFGAAPVLPAETLVVPAAALEDEASEVERLRAWIARTQGMDALQAQDAVRRLREEVAEARAAALSDAEAIRKVARDEAKQRKDEALSAEQQAESAHEEAEESQEEVVRSRSLLAELTARITVAEEAALLQEAGVYAYRHVLADAAAYRAELDAVQGAIKDLVKNGQAMIGSSQWASDGSAAEGRRTARDLSKLMLRAYNAEADNAVLTVRPHRLDSFVDRLDKCRETIAKLGAPMELRVADAYHEARVRELRLTADFLRKKDEEKEAERATRTREREEAAAQKELDRELERLRKEAHRCRTALERARKRDDLDAAGKAEDELGDAEEQLAALTDRAGQVRAGHVYVVSNVGAFGADVVRIGVTRRLEPLEEIQELSGAAVPFAFDVHAVVRGDDAVGLAERLHERFAEARINRVDGARGFYRVAPARVREVLVEFAGDQLIEFTDEQAAPEWRASITPEPGTNAN
ncbi:DUF4041 domain-containing protein [Streptantibioticus silvisoli]|uniref:DUF4041 domain-containing protein n=1 Tax=Streptantibioticus silvisoli TaxID=2705255 RepID=A0ABT6W8Q6_9ACTN|nr:DUF4041 domain-containing protein [Streptantibioticus silvisoli]MDI5967140.1 DUF4041 domain-containing protein [Streptantibioticus silvisoli]